MSAFSSRPYAHTSVFLPVQTRADDEGRAAVTTEWPTPRGNNRSSAKRRRPNQAHIAVDGFILVDVLNNGGGDVGLILVQSVSTGALFMNKILFIREILQRPSVPPLELRISSAPFEDRVGDQDPKTESLLPQDARWCNQLRYWQKLGEPEPGKGPLYSLYCESRNGGEIDWLIEAYTERQLPVPEHFIWLVAEQLCLALAWFWFGTRPDAPGFQLKNPWTKSYHRDIWFNNIFINYPPKRKGRIPACGMEGNAFPEIVLGDFGNAGKEGDLEGDKGFLPINIVPWGPDMNAQELRDWEDTYCIGGILRALFVAYLPDAVVKRHDPDKSLANIGAANGGLPYSDKLLNLRADFEWPNIDNDKGIEDMDDPDNATVANAQWCLDTLLPAAQEEVENWRNPPGGRPAGYFEELDVSWTKRPGKMPMAYNANYAEEADPQPGQVDVDLEEINDHKEGFERKKMRDLRFLHTYDPVKPPYELRTLEWAPPVLSFVHDEPPAAHGPSSSSSQSDGGGGS